MYVELDMPVVPISQAILFFKEKVWIEDSECLKQGLYALSHVFSPKEIPRGGYLVAISINVVTQERVEFLRVEWLKHVGVSFEVDVRSDRCLLPWAS